MRPPSPRSTLFPYTTLFRSLIFPGPTIPATSRGSASCAPAMDAERSEEHTSELQSHHELVCRLLLEKNKAAFDPATGRPTAASKRGWTDAFSEELVAIGAGR